MIADNAAQTAGGAQTTSPMILFARFMLPDMTEHPCQIGTLSLSKASLITNVDVPAGVHIVAYIEEVGRVEGPITKHTQGGFEIGFDLNESRRERFRTRLKWLREKANDPSADARRHPRYEPADSKSHITLPDGRVYPCQVVDISLSGAAVTTDILPTLGTKIMLGKMSGRVVRYLPSGLAIEFSRQLDQTTLKAQLS